MQAFNLSGPHGSQKMKRDNASNPSHRGDSIVTSTISDCFILSHARGALLDMFSIHYSSLICKRFFTFIQNDIKPPHSFPLF